MPTLNFDQIHDYDPGEKGISIPVELKAGGNQIRVDAKLDTGSSFCVFTREQGEALMLDIESGLLEIISTATGTFKAFGHSVTVSALGFELEAVVYFAAAYEFRRNVLGRFGWMQQLRIGIVDYDGQLYLSFYDQGPMN